MGARGYGEAHGAISVLNAIPTGFGGAVGVDLKVRAWASLGGAGVTGYTVTRGSKIVIEERILRAIRKVISSRLPGIGGFSVVVESDIPFASGLKGSSALVNSIIRAILDSMGVDASLEYIARLGVEASRLAGITITGAFDDSLATIGSGVYITNNREDTLLGHYYPGKCYRVAIHVPPRANPIENVDVRRFKALSRLYDLAFRMAVRGDWIGAMRLNGYLTAKAIGYGLDLIDEALGVEGVVAAGVSGKGPAVFAVFHGDIDLWVGRDGVIYTKMLGGLDC